MKNYQDRFTWAYPFDDNFIEHHDGALSCAISWDGIAPENAPNVETQNSMYSDYYQFINEISRHTGIVVENHFERSSEYSLAKKYIEYGEKNITRSRELGLMFRKELATHLASYGRSNRVMTVITLTPSKLGFFFGSKGRDKSKIEKNRTKLFDICKRLMSYLPSSQLLSADSFLEEIIRRVDRDYFYDEITKPINPRFFLNQQLIKKPEYINVSGINLLKQGKTYTQVCLLLDYPDAKPNWFYSLSQLFGVDVTVTQIIRPLNTQGVMGQSARESEKAQESANRAGGEEVAGKTEDMGDYRRYVSDNNLEVFANCYVLQFHSQNAETLVEQVLDIEKGLIKEGVSLITGRESVDYSSWRVALPAQGYLTQFSRDDHTWQIAHMAPVIKFDEGETEELQLLRLTAQGTLVGDKYEKNISNHRLTAAKTGAGKTVMQASEVCELYPLGFNFYVTEVGRGFEWVFQLFGGDYFVLDPETTVVSPFPSYSLSFESEEGEKASGPLPSNIILPTVQTIMPVLMGRSDWDGIDGIVHYKLVAEKVMQACYMDFFKEKFSDGLGSPTLLTFLNVLKFLMDDEEFFTDTEIMNAAEHISITLNSFLQTEDGKVFTRADSIDFNKPLIGVDFSVLLDSDHTELAKFMLTFITMRFKQLSFTTAEPCFIQCDEYHEFVAIDPILMGTLERQATRRGRKKAAYFNPISQAVLDMVIKSENNKESNINQYTHKYLMYYGGDFGVKGSGDYIPDIFKLPKRAVDIWSNYEEVSSNRPYAQCLRVNGESFRDYLLTYPQVFLDLTNSNPEAVQTKLEINKITDDPMEKLALFRKEMEKEINPIKEADAQ